MKRSAFSSLALGLVLSAPAFAGMPTFNLVINVTDPSAVTFTATSENAYGTASIAVNFTGGITLENFFPFNQSITVGDPAVLVGNLTPSGTSTAYNEFVTFNYDANTGTVESGDDLSVYNVDAPNVDTQDFVSGATAFTGFSTVDLTGYTLPTEGTWGAINIGYKADHGGTIGYWTVVTTQVPEASTYSLFAGALALAWVVARRRIARARD
jgi:hypothetical protein